MQPENRREIWLFLITLPRCFSLPPVRPSPIHSDTRIVWIKKLAYFVKQSICFLQHLFRVPLGSSIISWSKYSQYGTLMKKSSKETKYIFYSGCSGRLSALWSCLPCALPLTLGQGSLWLSSVQVACHHISIMITTTIINIIVIAPLVRSHYDFT